MSSKVVAERRLGVRVVAGTEWPILNQVRRDERGERVEWILTLGLCNGVPDGSEVYRTRRAALAALNARHQS